MARLHAVQHIVDHEWVADLLYHADNGLTETLESEPLEELFKMASEKASRACQWESLGGMLKCTEPLYDRTCCILHSTGKDKDPKLFRDRINGKLAKQDLDFSGTFFPSAIGFSGLVLRDANFRECEFGSEADFSNATFEGEAVFVQATFKRAADFRKTTFEDTTFFGGATFEGVAKFGGAIFARRALFSGAAFREMVWFRVCRFGGEARFAYSQFAGQADLGKAKFEGATSFDFATFECGVVFESSLFESEASFVGTEFAGTVELEFIPTAGIHGSSASFHRTVFQERVAFAANKFGGPVTFVQTHFAGPTLFTGRTLQSPLAIGVLPSEQPQPSESQHVSPPETGGIRLEKPFRKPSRGFGPHDVKSTNSQEAQSSLWLTDAFFQQPDRVRFESFDLRRSSFEGTNVRQIRFHNCQWPRKGRFVVIFDELRENGPGSETLRLLYRDLKANLEDARDYEAAGHFYYAEMEVSRRNHPKIQWRALLTAFWLLSGYAERPFYTAVVLSVILLVFAGVSMVPACTFSYEMAGEVFNSHSLSAAEALGHSVRVLLLRPLFFQPETKLAHAIALAGNIIGPLQVALLFIGLRRYFRR